MVVKEVKRLSELSDDKLAEFLIFAKEIVEHNFNNLKSKWSPKSIPLNYTPTSPKYSVFHQHQNEFHIGPRSDKIHSDSTFAKYSIYTMGNIYCRVKTSLRVASFSFCSSAFVIERAVSHSLYSCFISGGHLPSTCLQTPLSSFIRLAN